MEKDYTRVIAEYGEKLDFSDIPAKTITNIKYLILDYIGAAAAGYKTNKVFSNACTEVYFDMGGKEESSVLFSQKKLPAENAAFLNGVYAHGADMDDGNRKAMGHVGAHVIPAVLSLAQSLGNVSEKSVYTAIAFGYEIYCRCAAAVQPGLVKRGFHSTGTAGALACAGACAKLMGLDAEGIYNSIALSTTQAAGLLIVAESGQSCKPMNPARAAQCGILSAKLVAKGVKSFENPLQSKKGWFHAMSDTVDFSMLTFEKGIFAIDECYFKPYPSCRHTHCTIECASKLLRENKFSLEDIEKVNVYIYQNAIDIAGQIKIPQNDDDSKFSIHYSLAVALKKGNYTLSDLSVSYIDNDVEQTVNKIELISEPSMENRDLGIRGAKVELIMKNGDTLEKTVLIPKGDPENPFTLDDVKGKLESCAKGVIADEKIHLIISSVMASGRECIFDPQSFFGVIL